MQHDGGKKSKRYVLCKKEGDGVRPCAFFNTPAGCRSGSSCPFSHEASTESVPRQEKSFEKKRKDIGDSTADNEDKYEKKRKKQKSEKKEKSKGTSVSEIEKHQLPTETLIHSNLHSNIQQVPFSSPGFSSSYKLENDEDLDDSLFLFSAVNTALKQGNETPYAPPIPLQGTNAPIELPTSRSNGGLESNSFFLPKDYVGRVLETSGTDHATKGVSRRGKGKLQSPALSKKDQTPQNIVTAGGNPFSNIIPQSTFRDHPGVSRTPHCQNVSELSANAIPIAPGLFQAATIPHAIGNAGTPANSCVSSNGKGDWLSLVTHTTSARKYPSEYTFEKDFEWVSAKPFGAWCSSLPPVLGIDCEMCETIDPVTGIKNPSSLVRLSVVNGINPKEVLIDTLVAPSMPISTMRDHIHGITEDSLKGVTFTLRHAQAALLSICSDKTVLVGHALHHDLKAMKFDHRAVIDTAYLYTLENEPNASPGLRDIARVILNSTLSPLHDSVQDAQIAINLAEYVKNNGFQKPIHRMPSIDSTMLLIHRIPSSCNEETLNHLFTTATHVIPISIQHIQQPAQLSSSPAGKTNAIFASAAHANLAFESLAGPDRPDKSNRSQKRVYLKAGGYICVRKY